MLTHSLSNLSDRALEHDLHAAVSRESKSQIRIVLAECFPRPDVPARIRQAATEDPTPGPSGEAIPSLAPGQVDRAPHPRSRVAPLSPGRHEVRFTFSEAQLEKLRLAQCLLGRAVPSGAIEQVFEQAAGNLRLLCPAHNQLEADRVFGARFMEEKRSSSRARGRAEPPLRRSKGTARRDATPIAIAPGQIPSDTSSHVDALVPYLLALRFRKDEARRGAEMCEDMAGAPLEERMKVALRGLGRARFERCTQPATPAG